MLSCQALDNLLFDIVNMLKKNSGVLDTCCFHSTGNNGVVEYNGDGWDGGRGYGYGGRGRGRGRGRGFRGRGRGYGGGDVQQESGGYNDYGGPDALPRQGRGKLHFFRLLIQDKMHTNYCTCVFDAHLGEPTPCK